VDQAYNVGVVDPVVAPRPETAVLLSILDAQGRIVKPRQVGGDRPRALRVHELVLLECGREYGWELWPSRTPWAYDLPAGRYTAQVVVKIPVGSFFKVHEGAARLEGLWAEPVDRFIRDVTTSPVEAVFDIGAK
jgi:hypothetical protein